MPPELGAGGAGEDCVWQKREEPSHWTLGEFPSFVTRGRSPTSVALRWEGQRGKPGTPAPPGNGASRSLHWMSMEFTQDRGDGGEGVRRRVGWAWLELRSDLQPEQRPVLEKPPREGMSFPSQGLRAEVAERQEFIQGLRGAPELPTELALAEEGP